MRRLLVLVLAAGVTLAPAFADDAAPSLSLYLSRNFVCSRELASPADRKAADCDSMERDKAALLRQYRNQPAILDAINHPETVRHIGFSGVDRYPDPNAKPHQ